MLKNQKGGVYMVRSQWVRETMIGYEDREEPNSVRISR